HRHPPRPLRFPYTTLFRSSPPRPPTLKGRRPTEPVVADRKGTEGVRPAPRALARPDRRDAAEVGRRRSEPPARGDGQHRGPARRDRKSTRLNSSHEWISYA